AIFWLLISSCNNTNETVADEVKIGDQAFLLTLVDPAITTIDFRNSVVETDDVNVIKFEGLYNGSGVAVGDINNDGLADIYFGGNSSDDQLYLNKGNFNFENITETSGIKPYSSGWTTGVLMVDINADGFLDIYVCRSGPSYDTDILRNKLFINNRNGTFSEQAALYGLDNASQSRQTAFFDYDQDGDLDMYLMNQPEKDFKGGEFFQYLVALRSKKLQTDYFYENSDGKFVDKTDEAGLVSFGYGHSIAVSDINDDGYPDFHKTHDYDDPDFLFYNTGKKSFENKINTYFKHISWSSMGNDFADFNNDGLIDLFTLEMAPDDHVRSKVNMKSMDPVRFNALAENDQQYQYMFNTLQLNNGNNSFSEIAQLAGVSKTDWSWACLFFDIDLDGYKDIYISNGIKRDFLNRDIMTKAKAKSEDLGRSVTIYELQELIPSTISNNIVFKNDSNLAFKDHTAAWMDKSGFNTNGVAYGDLDNDGDLDLVTNNMEDLAGVYENKATDLKRGNFLKFNFTGPELNPFAMGTKVIFEQDGQTYMQELYNSRGYLSSMNYELVFGVGNLQMIDSVNIIWPDHKMSVLKNVQTNSTYKLSYNESGKTEYQPKSPGKNYLNKIEAESLGITFKHQENEHDDYKEQVLLPYSQSMHGPFIDKADVNGDGLEDFYVGGAIGQPGELYIQNNEGKFKSQISAAWDNDKAFEDLGVLFFDSDNDGDQDLYVVSGGAEFKENHYKYQDRLYINDGKGNFRRSATKLPNFFTSGQVVKASDIDNDGDLDLFVGGRIIPDKYPMPPPSHLLINDNGKFSDATSSRMSYFKDMSIVTDALFVDYDNDGDQDLITVGEWSDINFHENNNGHFSLAEIDGLEASRGLWFSIDQADIDGDGDIDFIAGNLGLNTKFKANSKKEFHVFSDDFDQSGTYDVVLSNTYNGALVPVRGRECSSEQMPFIKERFGTFQEFAEADLDDILGSQNLENALHYQADILESVYIENLGDGKFKMMPLVREAQISPIMNTEFIDLDKDGKKEIICLGNMHNVEVETMRYDASAGTILSYDNGFKAMPPIHSGLYANQDVKSSIILGKYLIITNNNSKLDIFEIN
ncbi:MAG: VCBS repeat-containing protein, partial [Bacteroidia bacterium]|nr:VCBS repeat-containing protein [Bacteroidia bacterium]